jgi:hypothetical protein
MEHLIDSGDLRASDEVLHDLKRKDDDVLAWALDQRGMFVETEARVWTLVQHILSVHKKLLDTRKSRSGADPFVIALAEIEKCGVVTDEKATGSDSRPNIPDVCSARGVPCITFLEMIQEQRWVFE